MSSHMNYFEFLEASQQRQAVLRLHKSGMSDHGIAAATRWSVEAVRRVIGEGTDSLVGVANT